MKAAGTQAASPAPLKALRARLLGGMVIPAHPLALTAGRQLDERRQRALTRYYLAAGAGGLAVGVHTTQFEIHRPEVGLYRRVLELAREEARGALMVAGIVGATAQAVEEAALARDLGYDCGLLSLAALKNASDAELIAHVRAAAAVLPVFGFYLQPAVGGRVLSYSFWRRFAEIENVVAIKIAPFNRYQTLDVARAVAESGRSQEIALYTGNDDSIVADLLTEFRFRGANLRMAGGLLGQWAVWTRRAVEMLCGIQRAVRSYGAHYRAPASTLTAYPSGSPASPLAPQTNAANATEMRPGHYRAPASTLTAYPSGSPAGPLAPQTNAADARETNVADVSGTKPADAGETNLAKWLALGAQLTDANAALFDPQHQFAGCLAGIHEVLRRQGLLAGRWCINPREKLSAGQAEEIDRVYAAYPHLNDDDFVRSHLRDWLA